MESNPNNTQNYKLPEGYSTPEGHILLLPKIKSYLIFVIRNEKTGQRFLLMLRDSRISRPWIEEKKRYGSAFPLTIEFCGGNASEDFYESCEETLKREVYEETGTYLSLDIEDIKNFKKTVIYSPYQNNEKKTYSVNEKHIYCKEFTKEEIDLGIMKSTMNQTCSGKNPQVERLQTFEERLAYKEKIQPVLVPLEQFFHQIEQIFETKREIKDLGEEEIERKKELDKKVRLLNYIKVLDVDFSPFKPDMEYNPETGKPYCNFAYEEEELELAKDHMRFSGYNAEYVSEAYTELKMMIGF